MLEHETRRIGFEHGFDDSVLDAGVLGIERLVAVFVNDSLGFGGPEQLEKRFKVSSLECCLDLLDLIERVWFDFQLDGVCRSVLDQAVAGPEFQVPRDVTDAKNYRTTEGAGRASEPFDERWLTLVFRFDR